MTRRTMCAILCLVLLTNTAVRAETLVTVSAEGAKLVAPFGIDFAADGTLYFVEMVKSERLRKLDAKGNPITLAGTGQKGFDGNDGAGIKATFNGMHSLAVGNDGTIYLADTFNQCIRKFNLKSGLVTLFAGTGDKGFSGDDGTPTDAKFDGIHSVAFDAKKENIYLADLGNRRVRKIDLKEKTVKTVAGNGEKGVPKDGEPAMKQPLVDPRAVAVDSKGRIYIIERSGHALRVVDTDGTIRTVAGTGKAGKETVGGDAMKAAMNGPKHLCIDRDDSVLIADSENHRILRYQPKTKTMILVAGIGSKGSAGLNGNPLKAELSQPHGVTVHPKTGELYIADSSNNRIVKVVK